jgi:predicted phosphodiesterase
MKIAIITDIHEDLLSLQEAFRQIEKQKCDEIVCLGDISGYSIPYYNYLNRRNAHACLSMVRSNCRTVILGNHDIHAASIIPKHCNFFDFPDNWYQLNYHQRHQMANNTLWLHEENDLNPLYKDDDLEYLGSLPEYAIVKTPEQNILFTHYIYPNISGLKREFYTYKDEFSQHFEYMDSVDCSVSFTGHTHVKGFFVATMKKYKQYRYKRFDFKDKPVCVGIPPITSLNKRNGFCIFDVDNASIKVIKL